MCCDLCDLYGKCREVVTPEALCCTECAESTGCRGDMTAGRHMMDDEEFDDAGGNGEDDGSNGGDVDYDDDDEYEDDYDYDDDLSDDDYESRH